MAKLRLGIDATGATVGANEYLRATDKVKAESRKTTNSVDKTSGAFDRMKKNLRSLTPLLGALAIGFSAATLVAEISKFEKGLIGVGKTTDITGIKLQNLGSGIRDMAGRLPTATSELLAIAQSAGQLGVKGSDNILLFTETVSKLGTASDLSGDLAATALARILTITGTAVGEVDVLGSVIVRLGNNFAATESEIASVATRVAQGTAQFKTTASEVAGIGAALKSVGVQAESGGTQVGLAFQAINDALRSGGKELKTLTEVTKSSREELSALFFEGQSVEVFEKFVVGLGNIAKSGGDVSAVLETMGLSGTRAVQVLATIAINSDVLTDSLRQAADEVEDTNALNKEAATAAETFSSQAIILGNSVKNLAVELGNLVLPDATEGIMGITVAVQALGNNLDVVGKVLAIFVTARIAGFLGAAALSAIKAAAGLTALDAALLGATVQMRVASAAATTLKGTLAFFGGPIGLAVGAIAATFLILADNQRETKRSSDELITSVKQLRSEYEKLNAVQIEGALITNRDTIAALREQQVRANVRLEQLFKESRFSKDINENIKQTKLARADLADATQRLNEAEGVQVELQERLKELARGGENAPEAPKDIVKVLTESQKAAKELGEQLALDNKQLNLLIQATKKGKEAVQQANIQIAFENALREEGIEAKSKEAKRIFELVKANVELADTLQEVETAQKKVAKEAEKIPQIYKDVATGIQSAFKTTFREVLDNGISSFKDLKDRLIDVFKDLLAELLTLAAANKIIIPIVTSVGGALGLTQTAIAGVTKQLGGGDVSGAGLGAGIPSLASLGKLLAGGGGIGGGNTLFSIGSFPVTGSMLSQIGLAAGAGFIGNRVGDFASDQLGINRNDGGTVGSVIGGIGGAIFGGPITAGIGAAIGDVVGNVVGDALGFGKSKSKIQVGTAVDLQTAQAAGFNNTVETAFGVVGLTSRSNNFGGGLGKGITNLLATIDNSIAGLLNQQQIDKVTAGLTKGSIGETTRISAKKFDNEIFTVAKDRLVTIIDSLASNNVASKLLDDIAAKQGNVEKLTARAVEIIELIKLFDEPAEPVNSAQKALDALNQQFDRLSEAAAKLGFSVEAAENKREEALIKLTSDFNLSIRDQILAITDPVTLALESQERSAQERLDNAKTLGADLVEVERLNALERQTILEQSNTPTPTQALNLDPIKQFLTGITSGASSPLGAQEVLANAQSRFGSVLDLARSGNVSAISNLSDAASNLLSAAQNNFGSSEQFFTLFNFVKDTLSNFVSQNEDPQDVGAAIVSTGAATVDEIRQLRAEVVRLVNITERQQETLDLLLNVPAG